MSSTSSPLTWPSPPVVPKHRSVQSSNKPLSSCPAITTSSRPVRGTIKPAVKPMKFQPRVILQRPKVSSFGPNAHLAKEFVPSSLRLTIAMVSDPDKKEYKDEPIIDYVPAPSPEPVSLPTQRSTNRLQLGALSSKWPSVSKLRRSPPGLPIHPALPVETDVFVGMSAKRRPAQIPFVGHHILEHTIQDVPICLSYPFDTEFDSFQATKNLAFDIHLPTLGLGLYDLLSASSSARRYAFPGFERSTNFHVTLFEQDSSLSRTSCFPHGLEQSHFSLFPSAMPLRSVDNVVVFDDLSAYSSRATTVCSSMSSSPTLSSVSTPGSHFHSNGNSVKHRETGKFVTDRNIVKVYEALEQTLEAQQSTARRVGTIGSHRRKSWMFADASFSADAPWSLADCQRC